MPIFLPTLRQISKPYGRGEKGNGGASISRAFAQVVCRETMGLVSFETSRSIMRLLRLV